MKIGMDFPQDKMLFLYYETAAEKRLESSGCGLLERKRVAWEKAAVEKMIDLLHLRQWCGNWRRNGQSGDWREDIRISESTAKF